QKQALAALRESKGGISEEKRARQKQRISARKAIKKFLEVEPASIPQIAAAVGHPWGRSHVADRRHAQVWLDQRNG
ncbi:MAG: hypothetical protein M3O31_03440, partial [Acidobacteriota bacterium]|nr:hypothetical protein [Acidobacteriota bacterium]